VNFYAQEFPEGGRQIEIEEAPQGQGSFPRITTGAQHINDGMLRLIAIVAELASYEQRFVLFDEIENGINPEVIQFVIDKLVNARQQVLVTTHSPMILNYLEDEVAKEGVIYLYKSREGQTRAIRFFDIPSVAEKLTVMGPGEAFADTDLTALRDEIEAVTEGR
jgi:predicted ATPase